MQHTFLASKSNNDTQLYLEDINLQDFLNEIVNDMYNPINSVVQIILASCYRYGKWVEKDERKAFNYYQKLAEMGDARGLNDV
ncbi:hypothetical protein C2G38_2223794 [Gigaspora rosea]|uniref:Uncharacterized protein n=1 Tax=Gigaspora rosea TaxID=44941 RepID=A0A397U126_9GLOM|nr:hypothetical protein C2G38_2223794 [Gigaspora rosea]